MELKSVLMAYLLLLGFVSGLPKVEEMVEMPPATTLQVMNGFGFRSLDEMREVLNDDEGIARMQKQNSADEELLYTLLHPMTVSRLHDLAVTIGEPLHTEAADSSSDSEEASKEVATYVQHLPFNPSLGENPTYDSLASDP